MKLSETDERETCFSPLNYSHQKQRKVWKIFQERLNI